MRYKLQPRMEILCGIRWIDFSFAAGVLYQLQQLQICLSFQQHALPGSTPGSGIRYLW
jgi:hypothetical protein